MLEEILLGSLHFVKLSHIGVKSKFKDLIHNLQKRVFTDKAESLFFYIFHYYNHKNLYKIIQADGPKPGKKKREKDNIMYK